MSWTVGQTVLSKSQEKIGKLLKIHEEDALLAVRITPQIAYGWAMDDCIPVDEDTPVWHEWQRNQTIYWGMEAHHGEIVGWESEQKLIIVQAEQHYRAIHADSAGATAMHAKRIAWLHHWGPVEDPVNQTHRQEWEKNDQWEEVALYLELLNERKRLPQKDALQLSVAWRRCGKPIRALQTYEKSRTQFPDGELLILTGVGGCYRDLGMWHMADSIYHELMHKSPTDAHKAVAARGLSAIATDQRNYEEALRWKHQAKEWDPTMIIPQKPRRRIPHASITQRNLTTLLATVDPDA